MRVKPRTNRAMEGRANPKGIPYLHVATKRDTAISEVRPWIGSYVSVGLFKLLRDLTVIACFSDPSHRDDIILYAEEPPLVERERAVWLEIGRAVAAPSDRGDDTADDVPTQIIAELFKREGYDGIAYRSAFGKEGYNVVVFGIGAADLTYCELHDEKSINVESDQCANPYWIKDYLKAPP